MNEQDYKKLITERYNKYPKGDYSANGIDYALQVEPDGWVTVWEKNFPYNPIPLLQACDEDKAINYCIMREKLLFPINKLVSEVQK